MDIVLTGIPRSGTTLACHLLNKCPNTVALSEPMPVWEFNGLSPEDRLRKVGEFFSSQRRSLLESGTGLSKIHEGRVPTNYFALSNAEGIPRKSICTLSTMDVNKPLAQDFTLVIKHPGYFTADLQWLRGRFPCFATIRNPLSVLLSWNTTSIKVHAGRLPMAEAFAPDLRAALDREPDALLRQIAILDWCFSQYARLLPPENIIRYEDTIATGGKTLSVLAKEAGDLDERLSSGNRNTLYDWKTAQPLAEAMIRRRGAYLDFYGPEQILGLLDAP
jgi:hypothetical protein